MSSLSQLQRATADPAVSAYLEAVNRDRKRKAHKPGAAGALGAAGLIGAGMGATWVGDHAMTSEDRLKLDNLSSLASKMDPSSLGRLTAQPGKDYQGSSQLFYDYVDRASEAATAKIFGKPVQDIITMLRKSPLFRGSAFDMAKADPFDLKQTDNHYKDFTAGPLAAYVHQLSKHDESAFGTWAATSSYIDPDTNRGSDAIANSLDAIDQRPEGAALKKEMIANFLAKREKADVMERPNIPDLGSQSNTDIAMAMNHVRRQHAPGMDTYREFRQGLDKNFNSFLKTEGLGSGENRISQLRDISAKLPHGREMDILRKFRGWVGDRDPEFTKVLDRVEPAMANGMAGPARFYAFGGNLGAKLLQDVPRALGTAAIAGGVGLGAYWLINKLRAASREKDLKEKRRLAQAALQGAQQKAASGISGIFSSLGLGDRLNPTGGTSAFAGSEPPKYNHSEAGMLNWMAQQVAAKKGLRAVGTASHSAGSQAGFLGYPVSRFADDPESRGAWAGGVASVSDTLRALGGEVKDPDAVMMLGCNNQGVDIPLLVRDALGKDPPMLTAAPPRTASNDNILQQAAAWGLNQKQPWLFPTSKRFDGTTLDPHKGNAEVPVSATTWLSPRIPLPVSAPLAGAAAGVAASELMGARKSKRPWLYRAVGGVAGAGLGQMVLLQVEAMRRAAANSGGGILGRRDGPIVTHSLKTPLA